MKRFRSANLLEIIDHQTAKLLTSCNRKNCKVQQFGMAYHGNVYSCKDILARKFLKKFMHRVYCFTIERYQDIAIPDLGARGGRISFSTHYKQTCVVI